MPASLYAQSTQETPRLLVVTFRSTEKGLGADAAEELRSRLQREVDQKKLLVIPKQSIEANLKASGFNPDSAPDPITSRLLAQQLRADQFVDGTATKTPDGYRLAAQIVLASNPNMIQPVPAVDDKKLGDAAKTVAKSIAQARQQLDDVMDCLHAVQAGQYQAAVQSAQKAIATYANSTNGRDCLAQAYAGLKMPPDSIIAVTAKVVQIDPKNKPALGLLAQAYKDAGNIDKAAETWTTLLTLDPKNVDLQTQVVRELATSGKAALAKPIIEKAVADNPNDPDLVKLDWLIMLASQDWKQAIQAGEQLAKVDTAAVDTSYFQKLAAAYAADSQPQKAAEVTSRAVAKYPNSASLWALNAQTQHLAGQTQQSIDAARRSLSINPKQGTVWLALAQAQLDVNQSDSAIASLKQGLANGADSSKVGTFLMVLGKHAYDSANVTKTLPDFQRSAQLLSLADSVAPAPPAEFLLGVSQYYIGALSAQQNQKDKSCDLANQAADAFTNAQMNIAKGGSVSPDGAKQLMDQITKFEPAVKSQVKVYCKKKK
ncbi:MAG TPA: tetratricopeptide repeat protein [Gemmatimonadaceae bacterium]|nr:tetratricopeptide repeat protein [Gemmatimonadaceae bacterium]